MKLVKNDCYGGFSLSPSAYKFIADELGKEIFFFELTEDEKEITLKEAEKTMSFYVYTVRNPRDYKLEVPDKDGLYTSANERAERISLPDYSDYENRTRPELVKAVEVLGEKANGRFADLVIIEIPDDIEYDIDEYDGIETVHELHRSW
jgi:hypothetical protein